jgi:hypothetical protein
MTIQLVQKRRCFVIEIPRVLAHKFRAMLRQSVMAGKLRSAWPLVLCRTGDDGLFLEAVQGDVGLRYHAKGNFPSEALAFRASVLAECEGRTEDLLDLEQVAFGKGKAQWTDATGPHVHKFETVTTDSVPAFPDVPKRFAAVSAYMLSALNEAAKTTARDPVRFALHRVVLRGQIGEVVATDGRQLLIQRGFAFPWSDDVQVPRLPGWGSRELGDYESVGIARTKSHVAVRVGPWTFLLGIDASRRYPDVSAVIPRKTAITSQLHPDPQDAKLLMATLPKLPASGDDSWPVTVDLDLPITVRVRADDGGAVSETVLRHSTRSGPAVRLCMDRRFLQRALTLGFTEIEISAPDKLLLCKNEQRLFLWMPLDPKSAIGPTADLANATKVEETAQPSPQPERKVTPMPVPQSSEPPPENGHTSGNPNPERWGIAEVIAETENLRGLLHDAAACTARLLAALKLQRRRSRAVQQAMQSLKELQLEH